MNKNIENKILEKICYQNFVECYNNLNTMKLYANNLNISIDNFLTYTYYYIEHNITKPDYVKLIDILSLLKDEDEVIKFFEATKADYKYLNNNLLSYYVYYRPHIYYLDNSKCIKTREKIKKYETYLYRKLDPIRTDKKIDTNYVINVIKSFINSRYSIKRFCFNNGIRTTLLNKFLNTVKKIDFNLYNEFIKSVEVKEQIKVNKINNDVINILEKIKVDPKNFSLIDLSMMTDYDVLELIEEADKNLEFEDLKLFRKVLKPLRDIDIINNDRINQLFNTNFTFNIDNQLVEITNNDKFNVIGYLKSNNIPVCNETFIDGCIRLKNNNLYNKNKKL